MNAAWRKKIFNTLFVLVIFALTMWSVFSGQDLGEMMECILMADVGWLVPAVLCVILFILGEAVITRYLLQTLGYHISFWHCSLYAFIGFFYSAITPSASGGQPMQLLAMNKDRLPVGVSTVVLALVTILYKMVLVVLGALVLLIQPPKLMACLEPAMFLIQTGMWLNVVFVGLLLLLMFLPGVVQGIGLKILRLIHRIRPFKDLEKQTRKLVKIVDQYRGAADFYRHHKRIILHAFLITLAQRMILFAVAGFTYCAFHLKGYSFLDVTLLQGMISVAADMLPLPGGMGASENLFLDIFAPVFGQDLLLPGMVISRGISYYTQLIISAVMTAVAMVVIRDKRKE